MIRNSQLLIAAPPMMAKMITAQPEPSVLSDCVWPLFPLSAYLSHLESSAARAIGRHASTHGAPGSFTRCACGSSWHRSGRLWLVLVRHCRTRGAPDSLTNSEPADQPGLNCAECGRRPAGTKTGTTTGGHTCVDDELPVFCPRCAKREFTAGGERRLAKRRWVKQKNRDYWRFPLEVEAVRRRERRAWRIGQAMAPTSS
jgi:hypothetical protein